MLVQTVFGFPFQVSVCCGWKFPTFPLATRSIRFYSIMSSVNALKRNRVQIYTNFSDFSSCNCKNCLKPAELHQKVLEKQEMRKYQRFIWEISKVKMKYHDLCKEYSSWGIRSNCCIGSWSEIAHKAAKPFLEMKNLYTLKRGLIFLQLGNLKFPVRKKFFLS